MSINEIVLSLQVQCQDLTILDLGLRIDRLEQLLASLLEAYQTDLDTLENMFIERDNAHKIELHQYKVAHKYLLNKLASYGN